MFDTKTVLAYNATGSIENPDHNFINTDGDFVQADVDKIPFALRTYKTGYIYIAGSKKSHLIKVGSSNEFKDRIKILNITTSKSGNIDDWELIFQAKTETLGKVERMFQQKLSEYKSSSQYEKGKLQNGGELYRCSYTKAREAMTAVDEEEQFEFTQINEKKHLIPEYQFKNLKVRVAVS
ncbi:MAG TPA: GIY-YIG nuclease family protein [Pedobacter sp.]